MAKNWWKAELNGVEVARGSWVDVQDALVYELAAKLTHGEPGPRGFRIDIRRAQSISAPERRRPRGRDVMLIDANGDQIGRSRVVGASNG